MSPASQSSTPDDTPVPTNDVADARREAAQAERRRELLRDVDPQTSTTDAPSPQHGVETGRMRNPQSRLTPAEGAAKSAHLLDALLGMLVEPRAKNPQLPRLPGINVSTHPIARVLDAAGLLEAHTRNALPPVPMVLLRDLSQAEQLLHIGARNAPSGYILATNRIVTSAIAWWTFEWARRTEMDPEVRAQFAESVGALPMQIRPNRNGADLGDTFAATLPVTMITERPMERVVPFAARDANPFFHLIESLWMLNGDHDVTSMTYLVPRMADYSDDGETLHGAYGNRWRNWFDRDQLVSVVQELRDNPMSRRAVIGMWDPRHDDPEMALPPGSTHTAPRDLPCNLICTVQRDTVKGAVSLVVFNRSNDVVWGAYGANVVQFSVLLEALAAWIDAPMGELIQISANWHLYAAHTDLLEYGDTSVQAETRVNPYKVRGDDHQFFPTPLIDRSMPMEEWLLELELLLSTWKREYAHDRSPEQWVSAARSLLEEAHPRNHSLRITLDAFGDHISARALSTTVIDLMDAYHCWVIIRECRKHANALPLPAELGMVEIAELFRRAFWFIGDSTREDWRVAARQWMERRMERILGFATVEALRVFLSNEETQRTSAQVTDA